MTLVYNVTLSDYEVMEVKTDHMEFIGDFIVFRLRDDVVYGANFKVVRSFQLVDSIEEDTD